MNGGPAEVSIMQSVMPEYIILIQTIFNLHSLQQIYGSNGGGTINQGYEHVIDEDGDGNSLRLTTRNPHQVSWGQNVNGNNTGRL